MGGNLSYDIVLSMNKRDIKSLLNKEDPIIFELGAHNGEDTLGFLDEFSGINLYCFEPDLRCIAVFNKKVDDERCSLIRAAVTNTDGHTTLHVSTGWPIKIPRLVQIFHATRLYVSLYSWYRLLLGDKREWDASSSVMNSVQYSKDWPWLTFSRRIKVKTIKLDTFTKENGISFIDFIWVDIQGAEKLMIEGGGATLKKTKYLYTEYGETSCYPEAMTRDETIELLQSHGYSLVEKYSSTNKSGDLLFLNMAHV